MSAASPARPWRRLRRWLLAELCIRFAEQLDGLVDFGGQLQIGPDLSGASPSPPRRIDAPEGLPGVLYATAYQTALGLYSVESCRRT